MFVQFFLLYVYFVAELQSIKYIHNASFGKLSMRITSDCNSGIEVSDSVYEKEIMIVVQEM